MIVTYKYYDEKKRRLAMAANINDNGTISIHYITCSKKDPFNKKEIRAALEKDFNGKKAYINEKKVIHHEGVGVKNTIETVVIPVHPHRLVIESYFPSWEKSFFTWANGNFYKKHTTLSYVETSFLYQDKKIINL